MKKLYTALFATLFLVAGAAMAQVNAPLVFGPYQSSSLDSGFCGNDWATDTFTRTFIVMPVSDGSFQVTELFSGTFITLAGLSPNDCAVTVPAGMKGIFYGDEAFAVPVGADFNPTAKCPSGCTGTQFFSAFFNITNLETLGTYAWQFHYVAKDGTTWNNTDHTPIGTGGNIY